MTATPLLLIVLAVCVTIMSVSAQAVRLAQAHKVVRTVALTASAVRPRRLFAIHGVVIWVIQKGRWAQRRVCAQILRIRHVMQEMRQLFVMSKI